MKHSRFTASEQRVLRAMYSLGGPATTSEIAKWARMSWNTADTALKNLEGRGVVFSYRKTEEGRLYWELNY